MNRLGATRRFLDVLGHQPATPVVASLGHPAYDLCALADRSANFYQWGSMGLASSMGLGLAMARPDLRVFVIDGDGSLLMNLGSLATIAWTKPANLVVLVMDNQEYATTGGQQTATAHGADLGAAALALGIAHAMTARTESELDAALRRAVSEPGPWLIVAKVEEAPPIGKPPLDCVFIKQRFMTAIGNPEPATIATSQT